jgi:hypothetical protein
MISIGKLKLGQKRKLFKIFKSSLMQSLNIYRTREGICFAFHSLKEFEIYLEKDLNWAGTTHQRPFRPCARRCSDRGRRYLPVPIIFPLPLSLRTCAQWRNPTPFRSSRACSPSSPSRSCCSVPHRAPPLLAQSPRSASVTSPPLKMMVSPNQDHYGVLLPNQ